MSKRKSRRLFRKPGGRRRKRLSASRRNTAGHPLVGALKGLLRVAEGTDLTAPADPEWGNRI